MVMMKKLYLALVLLLMSLVTLSSIPLKAATPIGTTFGFTYETKMGTNEAVPSTTISKTYGSTVTIDGGSLASEGYTFVTYIVNGKVEYALPDEHTFIVTSDLDITAFYKPDDTIMVAFMDANQDMIEVQYVASGASVTAPSTDGLSKPGYVVAATPWSGTYNNPTQDTVVWLQYTLDVLDAYTVTVNNGSADDTSYAYNEVATVTASGTGNFQHWLKDGVIVSLNPVYSFTVVDDVEITAVFDGVEASPNPTSLFINLLPYSGLRLNYTTYIGQFVLPTGEELIEFGLLISDYAGGITFDTPDVEKKRVDKYNPDTGEFVASLIDSTYGSKNVRGYMVTKNGETQTISYSDVAFYATDLFISEYIEGSSNNKAIEIYNGTGQDVDLSLYDLVQYNGGSASATTTLYLEGTLISGDVYVVANSSSTQTILDVTDITSGVCAYNGDDAVALLKSGSVIDVIGVIGVDPGSSWTVGDGATAEYTLVRKSSVFGPTDSWDTSEWDVYAQDTFSYLGSHINEISIPNSVTIVGDSSVMQGLTVDLSYTLDPNTSSKEVFWMSSNNAVATVDASGQVTGVDEGTIAITAFSKYNHSVVDTQEITVTALASYTVTYMSDGSQFTQQTEISPGSTTTAPVPAPEKEGYSFDGWYTSSDGGSTLEQLWVFESDTVNGDVTLYANWVETGTEVLAYSTGFESSEGFTAGTTYNNTTIKYDGLTGSQWGTYYGTASTTSPLTGSQSMQMRWYTTAPSNLGYTFTNFDVTNVTKVVFNASSTLGLNVLVQYSTDGGITWTGDQTFTLTGTKTAYTFIINESGIGIGVNCRIKFTIQLPNPIPTGTSRLYLDDVEIYNIPE
jgi:uncharacterized repeat protein (TIGR02543 family)